MENLAEFGKFQKCNRMNEVIPTIIREPNSILHQKCQPVADFEEAKKIAAELLIVIESVTKWWNRWLGFAANQIGYNRKIIALRNGKNAYDILVNPALVGKKIPFPYVETCFSLEKKDYYLVKRFLWAKVKYQDLNGARREIVLRGPSAIYQEMDHINGIMLSDIGLRIF